MKITDAKPFSVFQTWNDSKMGQLKTTRMVYVPTIELSEDIEQNLERIFYWGQNDFQAQASPSVSVGDIIVIEDRLFRVLDFGFSEII